MKVWRLCSNHHPLPDGEGARLYGGRWNVPGKAIVYTSGTLSLAVLKKLVHTDPDLLPSNMIELSADIPDYLDIEVVSEDGLPQDWRDYPAPESIQALGTQWAGENRTAVLSVPSVVVPTERNYLLNPRHADFPKIRWSEPNPFQWDPRLIRS